MNKKVSMEIISHIYKDDKDCWQIQSNEQHLEGVARLSEIVELWSHRRSD